MWLIVILVVLFIYILIIAINFSRSKKTATFNYDYAPPQLANLPSVDQYQTCYDPFGNTQYNLWYDSDRNRTLTTDISSSTREIVAKNGSQYVYVLALGRISCFPLYS